MLTAARLVAFVATGILVGGWAFVVLVWPDGASVAALRRLFGLATIGGLLAMVASIGLQVGPWGTALRSSTGRAAEARALLFVLSAPVTAMLGTAPNVARSTSFVLGAAAVSTGLLRVPGFTSHGADSSHPLLGLSLDLVHLGAVAVWFGGLVVLVAIVLPRRRPDELRAVARRFSQVAATAVGVLVVSGAALAWLIAGSVGALGDTRFGHVLLAKLAVFATLVVIADRSRRWAGAPAHDSNVGPFAVSLAAETALGVSVLAVASVLVATHPG